jgi:hypothetical protein
MGVILLPNGLPSAIQKETLSRDEIKLVTAFEAWCERRGIALDLICKKCLDDGHGKASRLSGNNKRDAHTYSIKCAHAERTYGAA